ncbi:MAG: alpha/beta hydrolase [Spirochaetaceae bacterium]|nr:alpha/beta hydrolase [Spirochaetaceae bacterium]
MDVEIRPGPKGLEGGQPWPGTEEEMKKAGLANPGMMKVMKLMPKRLLAKKIRGMMGSENRNIAKGKLAENTFGIAGPNGAVPVRSYRPEGGATGLPVFVYFHGGGWIGGSVGVVENICRGVADRGDCVALNVDYRLAPEHPFPQGLEDCRAVAEWSLAHATELGGDPSKVILAGDSAGGNLATVLALMARDAGRSAYKGQVLIYAAVDMNMDPGGEKGGANPLGDLIPNWYLKGDLALMRDPRVSPTCANDHRGLPAALVITAEYCFIRGQGEDYARKLAAAGVPVKALRYNGLGHAFLDKVGLWPESDVCIEDIGAWIKETCGT